MAYKLIEGDDGEYGSKISLVIDDNEPELIWLDMWQSDCPEDLTWHRYISDIFEAGVRAGKASE